jgi:hypothetical protein
MWGRLVTCGTLSKRPSPSFPDRLNLWLRLTITNLYTRTGTNPVLAS